MSENISKEVERRRNVIGFGIVVALCIFVLFVIVTQLLQR